MRKLTLTIRHFSFFTFAILCFNCLFNILAGKNGSMNRGNHRSIARDRGGLFGLFFDLRGLASKSYKRGPERVILHAKADQKTNQTVQAVHAAVEALPEPQRQIVNLILQGQGTSKKIADKLGISAEEVGSQWMEAKKTLQSSLSRFKPGQAGARKPLRATAKSSRDVS